MQLTRERSEIDHRTIKLLVGIIAITLPILTSYLAYIGQGQRITSISESYYMTGWPSSIFVGFLFAIGAFLCAFNGLSNTDMVLSKVAAASAFLIALFPCDCDGQPQIIPGIHYGAAAVMFLVLAYFCLTFYRRATAKKHKHASVRAGIYFACGVAILLSIAALAANGLMGQALSKDYPRFVFYGEAAGLLAFGFSWLTASRTIPGLTSREERFSPLRSNNPA